MFPSRNLNLGFATDCSIGKFHTHMVGLEPHDINLHLALTRRDVSFQLKLVG